ncbi:MAG: hypothetical protein J0H34_20700 [Rhizobiales bacterium]|nr:hypothetical protein [Hyphomicrobiales bacterium]
MSDLPILFTAPLVRAILREIEQPGTGKTQTRRVIPMLADGFDAIFCDDGLWYIGDAETGRYEQKLPVRYRIGDRLYVREAWCSDMRNDSLKPREIVATEPIWFAADGGGINLTDWSLRSSKSRPGMFMPRWASRLTLAVTDVRVQRLQEISDGDAIAEGLEHDIDGDVDGHGRHVVIESWRAADFLPWTRDPIEAYADLWDQLNHARGYGWHTNPWIVAYTFRPVLGNIDQVQP